MVVESISGREYEVDAYIESSPSSTHWGEWAWDVKPALRVPSGAVVRSLSHTARDHGLKMCDSSRRLRNHHVFIIFETILLALQVLYIDISHEGSFADREAWILCART